MCDEGVAKKKKMKNIGLPRVGVGNMIVFANFSRVRLGVLRSWSSSSPVSARSKEGEKGLGG